MQLDFHYYIAYAIAKEAGFGDEECNTVAYASQFTDDNTDRRYGYEYRKFKFLIPFPDKIEDKGKRFHPIITQAVSLEAKEIETQRYVYAPFHFLPVGNVGNENIYTKSGEKNPYCTIANSQNARNLMAEAVGSGDPYRIGVAMHTFADTFSHERFTAFEEKWNKVRTSTLPPIGHVRIFHKPDIISEEWEDKRFGGAHEKVDNKVRALDAIKTIFKLLKPSGNWNTVEDKFKEMVDAEDAKARVRLVRDTYSGCDVYDKDKWFREALKVTVDPSEVLLYPDPVDTWTPREPRLYEVKFGDDFEKSHWYKFQMAAKGQLAWVLRNIDIL